MRIAFVGDIHGHFDKMYNRISEELDYKSDMIFQLGDTNVSRNEVDLASMAVPTKYRKIGDFPKYYAGVVKIPAPTFFIHGNHENMYWLQEYPEGFKCIDNLHYLGRYGNKSIAELADTAGFTGLENYSHKMNTRIAWLSGTFSGRDFETPIDRIEPPQFLDKKQAVHFRIEDIEKLSETGNADILLLHELPVILRQHLYGSGLVENNRDSDGIIEQVSILDTLISDMRPRTVIIGHMHFSLEIQLGGVNYILLADVKNKDKQNLKSKFIYEMELLKSAER